MLQIGILSVYASHALIPLLNYLTDKQMTPIQTSEVIEGAPPCEFGTQYWIFLLYHYPLKSSPSKKKIKMKHWMIFQSFYLAPGNM